MSIIQLLRILYARRFIIFAALFSCLIVATITAFSLPERYTATTRILLDVGKPDPVTGEQVGGRSLGAYAQTQIELIKDYRTAGRVVDALGWTQSPELVSDYNRNADTTRIDLRRWLAQRIIGGTTAGLLSGTQILEISFTANSPDTAKQIADLLRTGYLEENLRFRRAGATKIADWYSEQADKSLALLRAAEKERNDYASANGIVLDQSNVDLESAKLRTLNSETATAGLTATAPVITGMGGVSPLDQIDSQIAQAAMTLGPNHPTLVALKRQRAVIASAPVQSVSGGGVNVAAIEGAYERQKQRVLGQSDKIDRIRQMQGEIDLRRDQYVKAAQRVADYRLESNVGETGIVPLADAVAPEAPSFPNIPAIIGGAFIVGAGLGVALGLLVELLARRVRSDEDLSYAVRAPVFASIGVTRKPDAISSRIIRFLERRKSREAAEGLGA